MLKRIATITSIALLFGTAAPAFAVEKRRSLARMAEMGRRMDVHHARMMMRAMLKRPELYQAMMEEINGNSDFQKYYNEHPGDGG